MYLNNKYSVPRSFLLLSFCFCFTTVKAQVIDNAGLKSTISAIATKSKQMPIEKVYLQFDKPYYSLGDVMHLRAYLLDADFLTLSVRSGLLYVELDNTDNKSVKRIMVPLATGIGWADIALNERDFPEGSYTLRAYTNWNRNFGEDYIFKKSFYISPATDQSLLVSTGFKLENNNLQANLQFTNLNKQPVTGHIQLVATDEKRTLYKSVVNLEANGRTDINFSVPEKTDVKRLYIIATEVSNGTSGRSAMIPVTINRPENIDIKFIPEGGSMVAGLPSLIGFKATGEDGKGIDISGSIYSGKQQQLATFKSIHKGIGSFEFTPQAGENYVARINLPGGANKNYPLPIVNPTGTTLKIIPKGNDSITITLTASATSTTPYYLIGQARGVVCYATLISFNNATVKKTIAKDLFPSGISRFTLLNTTHQSLNERMVYINHNDNLKINISPNKANYTTRDSVGLNLLVTDKDGKPQRGTFSVAVTDDGQLKADSTTNNMLNYLLLTSDLKDEVEDPGYYFSGNALALDAMLLTQIPAGNSWKDIFDPKGQLPTYSAEPEFAIQGKVTNVFNKPVPQSIVMLLSKKPALVLDAVTDDNGQFIFKGFVPVDSGAFLIQAKDKHGKTSNTGIEVNTFKSPVFTSVIARQTPWYVNSDTVLINNAIEQLARRKQENAPNRRNRQLREVEIRDTKIVSRSKNLNGPGEADQVLNLEDMDKAGKMTLRQLLMQKVNGFTTGQVKYPPNNLGRTSRNDPQYRISYKINDKEARFVFDGMDLDYFYYPPDIQTGITQRRQMGGTKPAYNSLSEDWKRYVDDFIDYFTAEEISGIEVMYNPKYTGSYINQYLPGEQASPGVSERYAYIEITTRTGQGPFMKKMSGTYIYKPIPFTLPKKFSSPQYMQRNSSMGLGTDLRSTIFWGPNITTDVTGKASLSFYSADKPGGYTLTIEGMDLNGDAGSQKQKIKIAPK